MGNINMSLLVGKNIKTLKRLVQIGYRKMKDVTNPIRSEQFIETKINEFGEEVSIYRTKRLIGKPKLQEKKIPMEIQISEQELKEESLLAWEFFMGDKLAGKNLELTPAILKKIDEFISKGIINKDYAEIFKKNINFNNISFMEKSYHDLAKSMGFKKYPGLVFNDFYSSCGFNPRTISVSPLAFSTKTEQIGALRHELEHFRQEELVYRILGEDKYINAKIKPSIQRLKINDKYCISKFQKKYTQLITNEIEQYKMDLYNQLKENCAVLKNARINNLPPTKQELKEAKLYIQAIEDYKSPMMVLDNIEPGCIGQLRTTNPELYKLVNDYTVSYNLNPLEKGAKSKENEIRNMFEYFIELF